VVCHSIHIADTDGECIRTNERKKKVYTHTLSIELKKLKRVFPEKKGRRTKNKIRSYLLKESIRMKIGVYYYSLKHVVRVLNATGVKVKCLY